MGSPMGAPAADPMGAGGMGDPMGGGPMGADPMADPMGGMGGDPMADPMGGEEETQPVPTHADVWDVLDAILNKKKIFEPKPAQIIKPPGGGDPMGGGMGGDPMGGMGGGAPMGAPMGGDAMGAGGAPPMGGPAGGGGPFLQG